MCIVSYSKKKSYNSKKKLLEFFANPTPKWAFVEITNACSHKCAWCYGEFNQDKMDNMSLPEFKTLASKAKEIGIRQITLSGGEPTEHPEFLRILEHACSMGFDVNVATHGDWTRNWAEEFAKYGVKQVQFNYQGKKHHDGVHQVKSYDAQLQAIHDIKETDIDIVGMVTIGKYNIKEIPTLFNELDALEVSRIRVSDTMGYGSPFMKDRTAEEIFAICEKEAGKLGYDYIQSYDPLIEGDIGIPCIALSKILMYVISDSSLIYCGYVPSERGIAYANFTNDSVDKIKDRHMNYIESKNCGKPYCMARNDGHGPHDPILETPIIMEQ